MSKKINPRIDIAFKKIFGVEENKDLLISLINSIVGAEDQVVEVTLLNPYNLQSFKTDKLSILDVKAKGDTGKKYNIEIQITDEADYNKRALYYWAKLYTEQLQVSEDYSKLSKAIGIHILNFTSIPEVDNYHNVFHIVEKKTGLEYFRDLELHTIELKKFTNNSRAEISDIIAKVKSSLDIWVAFLTRQDLINREHIPVELDNPELKKALHVLDVMNFGELELQAYEERQKWFMIEANTIKNYEDRGFKKGHDKGREEGREEGERLKAIKTAKTMKAKGIPTVVIAECTDLSEKEVEKL